MENIKEKYLVALSGLLQNILHENVSNLTDSLNQIFSKEEQNFLLGNNVQQIIEKANLIISSKEETVNYPLLQSIFQNLDLGKEYKKRNYHHKITPLNLSEDIFPTEDLSFLEKDYTKHWQNFLNEFNQKLKNSNLKFSKSPEKVFSLIYHLIYKYLWCIPSSNEDKYYPDISLFDHLRVLSAVSTCFYDFNKEGSTQKNLEEFKDKKVFLHLKGDISGIQKFIYNVYQGKGGIAKTLRGRSFYVALLPEVLSRYILNELSYPISNLLYSGGGIFEILVANTEKNEKKLRQITEKINRFLAIKFEADLGLSIGIHKYSPIDIMEDYEGILRKLNESLYNAKKQKFSNIIETGEIFKLLNERSKKIHSNKKKCPVCQTYLIDENLSEEDEICDICKEFRNIGHNLPRTKKLVFAKSRTQNFVDNEKVIDFGDFGTVYLISKDNYADLQSIYYDEKTTEVLDINDASLDKFTTGFKFIGKVVPEVIDNLSPEEIGEEEIHKGQIAPFTYLATYSEGDERIGILRMDVDNLGRLFSQGLNKISISRIATLSRSLDLFFAGYLNKICENLTKKYKNENFKINNLFYILYSGGDDVFLIAPWDKAIEVAEKIQQEFEKYVCYNPNITISAGYLQTKPKFPIRVSADLAGEAEEIAKKQGKNRICVLGDVLNWDELINLREKSEDWKEKIKNNQLQRGFIYVVHRLKEQFLKDENKKSKLVFPYKKQENLMFYPFTHYYIARNITDEKLKKEIANFLLTKENFNKLTFITNYVALKTRK